MRAIVDVVVRYGLSSAVALHRIYIVMRSLHALGRLYYSYIIWIALKETLFIGPHWRRPLCADYAHGRNRIYGPVITIVMSISLLANQNTAS